MVLDKGISIDPSKIEAVLAWERLKMVFEISSFLGIVGSYRRFLKDFSKLAAPLTCLTRKGTQFESSDDCVSSFLELKSRLTTAPYLSSLSEDWDILYVMMPPCWDLALCFSSRAG